MESDWKKFRAMTPGLRERYLAGANARIRALLGDPERSETERFWDAWEEMKREAEVLHDCLDGHTRSKMWFFMLQMIRSGMLTAEDLEGFSDEVRQRVRDAFEA